LNELLELIKSDSRSGWRLIFSNFLSSLKASVFYPVMTSFSDWEADYSIGNHIDKFVSQQDAIIDYFGANYSLGKEPGKRIYPTRTGKGSRWLFGHQMRRVSRYSKEKLRQMLYEFSVLGRAIPISGWENSFTYGQKIKTLCDDYREYLKIAYLLPPSWYVMDKVRGKSWLKVLIDAGILHDGLLRTARGIRCIAKDGHECNSLAELDIDNWFYLNDIPHEKEPLYPRHLKYNPKRKLRADFKVKQFLIEYAGLLDEREYAKRMREKEALANELNIKLIIVTPKDFDDLDCVLGVIKRRRKFR
jgi:CRISPR/Cas system-associated protein endoribonuclease Cas2